MGEEAVEAESCLDILPPMVLAAVIRRERQSSLLGYGGYTGDDRVFGRPACFVSHFRHEEGSALPLKQSIDARCMVARLHGVVLPVADTGTPIDDGRPDINGGPLGPEDTLSFAGAVMLTALLPAPEIRTQVLFARLHPPIASPMHLGVYELIDGLVRDVTDAFALHPAGDLFGRPPHFQMFDDILAYLGRLESVFQTPLLPIDERPTVCEPGRVQIPLRRQVPVDLPDDSGVWTAETLGNRPYRFLVPEPLLNPFTFLDTQMCHIPAILAGWCVYLLNSRMRCIHESLGASWVVEVDHSWPIHEPIRKGS